jgi:hypothetical protein
MMQSLAWVYVCRQILKELLEKECFFINFPYTQDSLQKRRGGTRLFKETRGLVRGDPLSSRPQIVFTLHINSLQKGVV